MCKRLSERAADDLLAFVRKVRRAAYGGDDGAAWLTLACLDEEARVLLAKHGLLTPADDPEVAAVFMEEEPAEEYWRVERRNAEMEADNRRRHRYPEMYSGPVEEPATRRCTLGVGCEEYGVCFADAHGQPEQCGKR